MKRSHWLSGAGRISLTPFVRAQDEIAYPIRATTAVREQECHLMLIERKTSLHTGNVVTEMTWSLGRATASCCFAERARLPFLLADGDGHRQDYP